MLCLYVECNGKYVFLTLDEFDAPIFIKDNDKNWRILRLDHDEEEGHSIWGIQHSPKNLEYYIGISETYSPPNNTWETIEENAKNPAPGLQFHAIDSEIMRNLVPDSARITTFVPTKRKRKKGIHALQEVDDEDVMDKEYEFGDNDALTMQNLNMFKEEMEKQIDHESSSNAEPFLRKVSFNPTSQNAVKNDPKLYQRSESIMSTQSIYAVPDDVQNALSHYQDKVADLEQELKAERKRAMTLTHQHKTQQEISKEASEKLNQHRTEFTTKMENARDELYTVNNAYYQLWIKQNDQRLDYTKLSRESYKIKAKFSQTKKQLFQAKRKMDDMEDEIDDLRKELEAERMKERKDERTADDIFAEDVGNGSFDKLELQTEIASLKAQSASKDILIDELREDNEKWQQAHDSIFERMTEAQTRLAREVDEFEDAKKFYENKLSVLRDKLQDNSIHLFEYERRVTDIKQLYEANGKKLPEWKNKPKVNFNAEETMRYSKSKGNKRRGSESMSSTGWDHQDIDQFGFDPKSNLSMALTEYEDEEDNNNAFGASTPTAFDAEDANGAFGAIENYDDEYECDSENDGANAFGS